MGAAAEDLAPGTMIGGRFRVESLLGSGGMADVYRAVDAATGKSLALKILREDAGGRDDEAVQRVRREGEVLKALAHPAIVRLETFGQAEDGRIFIAMELLEGETLGDRMRRGVMSAKELLPIVAGTCAGLAAAHGKGVVHRDLKPDNIFLTESAGALQVKLLDFGIAKVDGAGQKLTQTGEVLGTPRYMAPEQLSAERDLDGRTDVYALGVILYEAIAGKPPFLSGSPTDLIVAILHGKHAKLSSVRTDVPPAVEALVARAMSRAREARFGSAHELAEAYMDAAQGVAPSSRRVSSPREGMATAFMGSVDGTGPLPVAVPAQPAQPIASPAQPVASPADAAAPGLAPGTFSEIESVSKVEVEQSARAVAKTEFAGSLVPADPALGLAGTVRASGPSAAPSKSSAADGAATRPAKPTSGPGSTEALTPGTRKAFESTPPPSAPHAAPVAHGSGAATPVPSDEYRLPTSSGPTKLIVVGLLAGAISAGIAVAALSVLGSSDESEDASTEPVAGTQPSDETVAPDVGAPIEAQTPPPIVPDGVLPPTEGAEQGREEADESANTRTRSGRRGRTSGMTGAMGGRMEATMTTTMITTMITAMETSMETAPPAATAAELTTDARNALRQGDARRCAELAGRALSLGAGVNTVRLRGDCLLGAGDRAGALAAYERFCRQAPSHPSATQVRAIVEGMGGSCN